ncbi:Putative hydrolase OS=Tsukamurella paurometabola (strain ATCC 8368 / DSM / CCUG 35730 / CIP 100753 / JCM 10117 / KCTC 9821 / NBRC 16120 / NCIMB 702349 /NCTC 13040) OX=521096 GN=Tpau_3751 PE=4 SV=1 [Tsukamurella paurometabola]|uniref:Putative hydrolase n=1 Tax=Tsukamurella paurometabola (strain ATCC 8368 / DSM 20162 / CCUG 35730 / CIP 100753 / JCM 10117 / KCTC 9821 / NBRC 16120 / NCIMB 702349 / NCTC 13040) TaxID=521096 RepID=D5UYM6_TSUPD|nr:DUF4440 domain-containing protein [Tsukamurella paurometabola]ADG80329.1 putative hydrolase [Tsukamurella paurometabola DSM 20162]SUP39266.1 Uncharacterised protein [Tsukamurella paurometabola]
MAHDPHDIRLTTDAARHPDAFATAFNSGDPDMLESVYEPEAPLITREGLALRGAARRDTNARLQALGVPIQVTVRQVHEYADELALLIVDWIIRGESPATGALVDVTGTATDVIRRGPDGLWRYVIDNPFGVAAGL